MLAEARGPDPLGPGAPWKPSVAGDHIKHLGNQHRHQLVWEDWDPGNEFTKTLVLKNIHSKLQKLHLRPPVSKFFTTSITQLIVISPGTSFSVPITFRPLLRCEYEDNIEFQSKDGSFQVCLRAIIPCHALEAPESLLLPLCAVQHSSHTTFLLRNTSKLQTCFKWECAAPFKLSPERGLLKPGQECHITVAFQPQEALLYQKQACCRFGEEGDEADSCCTVHLQGLAKYPCLQLKTPSTKSEKDGPVLPFGSVAVGQRLQKYFDIFNPSPVTATFCLSRLAGGAPMLGSEVSCDVTEGEVAPGGSVQATVTYTPAVVDTVSVEYLSLECKGALNKPLLKITGNCIGPQVSMSSSVVDFGCVKDGGAVVQTVDLVNCSPAEAFYQWDLDYTGHSVFSIQPACGTVRPHSHTTVKAVYRPTQPIAHHRRVACFILHRDPLFLDLIGTCHSDIQQPAVLKPEHLVRYKLHRHSREEQTDSFRVMQQDHNVQLEKQGALCAIGETNQQLDFTAVMSSTPIEDYFQACLGNVDTPSSTSSGHVSVVPNELLFNHKLSSFSPSSASSQAVSLTNHTRKRLSLVWTISQDSPFSVSPSSCDLAPLKSTSFRVTYVPKQLNTLHGAQLECFAYYKDDQVKEQLLRPPWCVTIRVIGHSFQLGKEHFIPCCSLKPDQVVFPGLSVLSYRTVLLHNDGDLPLTFCLNPHHSSDPALAASVSVLPSCVLIQPGDHQILTLRTTPTEDCPKFTLHLQLNAAKHTQELTVVSMVEKLCVFLGGDGSLYFQPTHVGCQTQCTHLIRNLCRLPLRFQWSIPESDREFISVEPDTGELQPNESSFQTWSFSPLEEKTYTIEPTITFWPIQTPGCNKSQLPLKVVGVGAKGFIEAERALLDVGETLVGSYRSINVPLVNNSPCAVSFSLSVQQRLLDEQLSHDPKPEPSALQLDCEGKTIASHSKMLFRSTFKPHRRAQYQWTISYQTLNASGSVSSPPTAVCEVRAKAVFPTLQVIDACSGGSVRRLSKVQLWKLFSLDSLNEQLHAIPSPAELMYKPRRSEVKAQSQLSSPTILTEKAILDFNFGAAPLNSDPSTFVLIFHNPGGIPVDWAFLFPDDQQIEFEYWAERGLFNISELHQMKVQDNHLFNVSPRSGTLLPGQQMAVNFCYSHNIAGTNQFPAVFKLSRGREILLNLQGVTVERETPHLHSPKQHVFTSVTIGDLTPPVQVYNVYNGGAVPVHYEVDAAVLSQLQVNNFDHPVLCCLNPSGEILPGRIAMLEFIFSPLEAKTYHMEIPIHVQDGDSTLVRFEGCGLFSPTLPSSNPFKCSDAEPSVPCVPRVPFPGEVVSLSEDRVSIGNIPVCSRSSRILFLTNVSSTETVCYTWDLVHHSNQQVVQIHPEQGRLCPGESVLCVFTFTSTDYPTVYQLDIICQLTSEAALSQYHDALQRWEHETQRQQDEFTFTDINVSQAVLTDKASVAAPLRKGPPLRKYKTLPPICPNSNYEKVDRICNKSTRAERRAQRELAQVLRRPEPPQPALLHLEVTAHSHGTLEYLARFPDQFNKHYRCLQSIRPQKSGTMWSSTPLPAGHPQPTPGPERDILQHVLTSLLRDILDDETFAQSLLSIYSRPITYQQQETTSSLLSSSPPPPQTQVLFNGTQAGMKEQHHTVDSVGTAGRSENMPQTRITPHCERAPAAMCEDILLNTLQNLMMEAVRGELDLTVHPRSIILPPVSARTRRMSRTAGAEEDREKIRKKP